MDTAELIERIGAGERYAPDPGAVLATVDRVRRQRRRRRVGLQVASVAAGVIAIAVAATTIVAHRPGEPARPPAVIPGQTGLPSADVSTLGDVTSNSPAAPARPVSVAQLQTYRWTTMPNAPIRDRDQAAVGWTGSEMLVWGGVADDGKTDVADGAAYDPVTHRWRGLPASRLTARVPQASVWTGTEFIVWGGDHGETDGAAYSPATNSWRAIPKVPGETAVGANPDWPAGAVAAWTGEVLQLLTWRYQGSAIQSWYYSPSRNTWTAGDPIQPRSNALIGGAELLVRSGEIDAFVGWSYQDTSGGLYDRVTAYVRTSGDPSWHTVEYRPALDRVGDMVDAGTEILMSGGQPFAGFHPSPAWTIPGRRLDPATGVSTTLPDFPGLVDMGGYQIAWTGAALLGYGSDSYVQDPDGTAHLPGQAAAWQPTADSWTALPAAPLAAYGTAPGIWTGTELLTWGLMFPPDKANDQEREVRGAGLIFGPAG